MVHKLLIEIISKIFTYLSIKDTRICANVYDTTVPIDDIALNSTLKIHVDSKHIYSCIDKNCYSKFRPLLNGVGHI